MSTENGNGHASDGTLVGGTGNAPAPTPEEVKAREDLAMLETLQKDFDESVKACDSQTDAFVKAGGKLVPLINFKIVKDGLPTVKAKDIETYSTDMIEASRKRTGRLSGTVRGVDLIRAFFYAENAALAGFGYPEAWTTCQAAARKCISLTYDKTGVCGEWQGGPNSRFVTLARFAETATREALSEEIKKIGQDKKLNETFAGDKALMEQMAAIAKRASDIKAIKKAVRESVADIGADDTASLVRESFDETLKASGSKDSLLEVYARLDAVKAAAAADKAAADKAAADAKAAAERAIAYAALTPEQRTAFDKAAADAEAEADKAAADKAEADKAEAEAKAETDFLDHVRFMHDTMSEEDILALVNIAISEHDTTPVVAG